MIGPDSLAVFVAILILCWLVDNLLQVKGVARLFLSSNCQLCRRALSRVIVCIEKLKKVYGFLLLR